MPGNPRCTVYVGNLNEKVNDRVLYEILIQAGRVVDLYIPRDRETNRPKGFAFAEYETEEIADYAVRLFSGLVTLYNRSLKFAISGQDKPNQNSGTFMTPASNSSPKPRTESPMLRNAENFHQPLQLLTPSPGSDFHSNSFDYSRRVFGAESDSSGFGYSRRVFEAESGNPSRYRSN